MDDGQNLADLFLNFKKKDRINEMYFHYSNEVNKLRMKIYLRNEFK